MIKKALFAGVFGLLSCVAFAGSAIPDESAFSAESSFITAGTRGQDRRDDRDDNRDDRQDCRQDEGVAGSDKRDCKQDNSQGGDAGDS